MRKLYILCLVTLAAVFMDVVFLHSGTVSAQNTQVEVRKVEVDGDTRQVGISGTVVGFKLYFQRNPVCFVATSR
jgi:hypothetical protein